MVRVDEPDVVRVVVVVGVVLAVVVGVERSHPDPPVSVPSRSAIRPPLSAAAVAGHDVPARRNPLGLQISPSTVPSSLVKSDAARETLAAPIWHTWPLLAPAASTGPTFGNPESWHSSWISSVSSSPAAVGHRRASAAIISATLLQLAAAATPRYIAGSPTQTIRGSNGVVVCVEVAVVVVGLTVGELVGPVVGDDDGLAVGLVLGAAVGATDGPVDGDTEGLVLGVVEGP